jgi:hypothetical protein
MFVQKNFMKHSQQAKRLVQMSSPAAQGYFSVFEKMRDRFNTPLRHIKSFTEPDGYNYQSQMPATYYQHGNTIASFSASVTANALELH